MFFSLISRLFKMITSKVFIVFAFLMTLISASAIQRTGNFKSCNNGQQYNVNFNTIGYDDSHFIVLNTIDGLVNVVRDIDKTRILIEFSGTTYLDKFINKLSTIDPIFTIDDTDIRRVLNFNVTKSIQLELLTTTAKYDEIFEIADITLDTSNKCDSNDVPICLGINTNGGKCDSSLGAIPIYSNSYISVSCSNCFLGFYTDVFFEMHIRWFKLESISGGFKNMALNGALVIDAKGNYAWSTGVDKILPVVKPTIIISFHIGPIPIKIWFEINVEEKADVSLMTSGEVMVGATAKWTLGDNYLSWDPNNHWNHHQTKPIFSWNPILSVSGNMNANAMVTLTPTLVLHVDNIYTYWTEIEPILMGKVSGSIASKQVCAELDYEVAIKVKSELAINIPWIHVGYDKVFDWKTIFDTGIQPIGTKCVNF